MILLLFVEHTASYIHNTHTHTQANKTRHMFNDTTQSVHEIRHTSAAALASLEPEQHNDEDDVEKTPAAHVDRNTYRIMCNNANKPNHNLCLLNLAENPLPYLLGFSSTNKQQQQQTHPNGLI